MAAARCAGLEATDSLKNFATAAANVSGVAETIVPGFPIYIFWVMMRTVPARIRGGCASATELDRNAVKPVSAASRTSRLPQREVCKASVGVGIIAPVLLFARCSAQLKNKFSRPSKAHSHLPLPCEGQYRGRIKHWSGENQRN